MSEVDKQFEEWAVSQGLSVVRTPQALCFHNGHRRVVGDYIAIETLCAYEAWKRSREEVQHNFDILLEAATNMLNFSEARCVGDIKWKERVEGFAGGDWYSPNSQQG